jgi:hypothetical protein
MAIAASKQMKGIVSNRVEHPEGNLGIRSAEAA